MFPCPRPIAAETPHHALPSDVGRRKGRGPATATAAGLLSLALAGGLPAIARQGRTANASPTPAPGQAATPSLTASPTTSATGSSDSGRHDATFPGGPGGKIKVWVEREHNVETTLLLEKEARIQFDFKSFLEEVRKMVSPIITTRLRVELGHEYQRRIRKGMYGHMRYRVFGYKVSFWQWRQFGNCSLRFVGTGLADIPTTKQGWKYRETKGP